MSHGLQVWAANGTKIFDSTEALGGLVVAVVRTPDSGTATYTFPEHAGFSGDWAVLSGYFDGGSPLVSVYNFGSGPSFTVHSNGPMGPAEIALMVV